ncbi:hypothetical protein KC734_11585 [candidate division KSB1 bacterium]|nr:hypothetical protein [candidate division KSB1 bacterium]
MNDSLLVSPLIGPNATVKTKVKCTLKAYNGQYVCAEGGGGREVVANRNEAAGWEIFTLYYAKDNKVALQANNGQYICAEGGGGREVVANRNIVSDWETFTLVDMGNNSVALQAWNGQYVCAEGGGGREIVANRNAIAGWETFRMNIIETISSVDSSLILVDIKSSTLL